MRRREFLLLLGCVMTPARALHAQQKAMPVTGFLGSPVPGSATALVAAFLHGLEEIHVPAGELRDTLEVGIGGPGGEAIIPHELPDDGAVLRLDVARSCFFQARLRVKGIP